MTYAAVAAACDLHDFEVVCRLDDGFHDAATPRHRHHDDNAETADGRDAPCRLISFPEMRVCADDDCTQQTAVVTGKVDAVSDVVELRQCQLQRCWHVDDDAP